MTLGPFSDATHVIVPGADAAPYGSLRRRSTPRAERYALGKQLREHVPRSALADWAPPPDRRTILDVTNEANQGRLDWLVPVRIGRMIANPYAFLRGAAAIHADDFARLPATGIQPVICGDAHLGNFGFYASPERDLVFDLNDFDEAHPGAWEWDLRRLVTSFWVAGRQNGYGDDVCSEAVARCSSSYRDLVRRLADEPLLARAYNRLDAEQWQNLGTSKELAEEVRRAAKRARKRTSDRALPRYTYMSGPGRRIVDEAPLVTHVDFSTADALADALDAYLETLALQWRRVIGGYSLVDIVHKVVGVGSVGLRAYLALCEGSSPDDVLFLQLKQARRSVVARHVHGEAALHAHQGQRVVEYQQALQTVSDPLLGWTSVGELQFYVRQFRDMKGAILVDGLDKAALVDYGGVCGGLLAKGHARTSGASMIAGYVGGSAALDDAMVTFARAYADQTERDHADLVAAVKKGKLPAEEGI